MNSRLPKAHAKIANVWDGARAPEEAKPQAGEAKGTTADPGEA